MLTVSIEGNSMSETSPEYTVEASLEPFALSIPNKHGGYKPDLEALFFSSEGPASLRDGREGDRSVSGAGLSAHNFMHIPGPDADIDHRTEANIDTDITISGAVLAPQWASKEQRSKARAAEEQVEEELTPAGLSRTKEATALLFNPLDVISCFVQDALVCLEQDIDNADIDLSSDDGVFALPDTHHVTDASPATSVFPVSVQPLARSLVASMRSNISRRFDLDQRQVRRITKLLITADKCEKEIKRVTLDLKESKRQEALLKAEIDHLTKENAKLEEDIAKARNAARVPASFAMAGISSFHYCQFVLLAYISFFLNELINDI